MQMSYFALFWITCGISYGFKSLIRIKEVNVLYIPCFPPLVDLLHIRSTNLLMVSIIGGRYTLIKPLNVLDRKMVELHGCQ